MPNAILQKDWSLRCIDEAIAAFLVIRLPSEGADGDCSGNCLTKMGEQWRMSFNGKQPDLSRRLEIETLEEVDKDGEEGDRHAQVSGKDGQDDDFGHALNRG